LCSFFEGELDSLAVGNLRAATEDCCSTLRLLRDDKFFERYKFFRRAAFGRGTRSLCTAIFLQLPLEGR
jgi:hypothetical protein